jgi:hypothetical protein
MKKHNTGMIRLVVGILLVFGAVGGMDHNPEGPLLVQLGAAVLGLALMAWAARDINRNIDRGL